MGEKEGIKSDCFAFFTRGKLPACKVLTEMMCKNGKCGFYKAKGTLCDSCNKAGHHICAECKEARKLYKLL